MSEVLHFSVDLEDNGEGWYAARCDCGWEAEGVYPSAEDACDALMDHAYGAGIDAATAEQQRWATQ